MTDPPLPARRFTETDTDAILRRTAELASGADSAPASRGLTLDEMEALARDAGLSPELVRRAAREVSLRATGQISPFTGGPRRLGIERIIPGELTEDGWEAIVGEVQRTLGLPGFVSKAGRTHTWAALSQAGSPSSQRQVSVTVTEHDGNTVVRVDEPLARVAGAVFGGLMGGLGGGSTGIWFGIGMGVYHSLLLSVAGVLTTVGVSYLLARPLFKRAAARRLAELNAMLDRMVTAISETAI